MTASSEVKLEVFADAGLLAQAVAQWLLTIAKEKNDVVAIALSGGTTPRGLYQRLAGPPYVDSFPWLRTHWFWGDERFVPPDDARSNFNMVRKAMLAHVPAPIANIHVIPTQGNDAGLSAATYERDLKTFYGSDRLSAGKCLFDVVLLGLGGDGHTASLFPGSHALRETQRWVTAIKGACAETRITLTFPALNSTRHAAFLVSGAEKRSSFNGLRQGLRNIPASRICPAGELHLFADTAAAQDASL